MRQSIPRKSCVLFVCFYCNSFMRGLLWHKIGTKLYKGSLEWSFSCFAIFSTAADGHLGLPTPSHINLKGLHLQNILIECD